MVTYNDYYHNKRIIREPDREDLRFQDPSTSLHKPDSGNGQDYQNPGKVGNYSLEEDFKRTTKEVS